MFNQQNIDFENFTNNNKFKALKNNEKKNIFKFT